MRTLGDDVQERADDHEQCLLVEDQDAVVRADQFLAMKMPELSRVMSAEDIVRFQNLVRRVPVSPFVVEYAVRLARATRPDDGGNEQVKRYVSWGAGPRASQYLILGAKTWAAMNGSVTPSCEDVRRVARPVLRHRVVTNFSAEAEGVSTEDIINGLLETVPESPAGKK